MRTQIVTAAHAQVSKRKVLCLLYATVALQSDMGRSCKCRHCHVLVSGLVTAWLMGAILNICGQKQASYKCDARRSGPIFNVRCDDTRHWCMHDSGLVACCLVVFCCSAALCSRVSWILQHHIA